MFTSKVVYYQPEEETKEVEIPQEALRRYLNYMQEI